MSDWPIQRGGNRIERATVSLANSLPTSTAAGGTAHVKGGWTQLVGTLPCAMSGMILLPRSNDTLRRHAIDLGLGAAAAEVAFFKNMLVESTAIGMGCCYVPVGLPAGARLSMRSQSDVASAQVFMGVHLIAAVPGMPVGFQRATNYGVDDSGNGVDIANTLGVTVDAGAAANTKGAWSDIVLSTSRPIRALFLNPIKGGTTLTTTSAHLVDVGVWDGAAYQPIIENVPLRQNLNINLVPTGMIGPFFLNLPAGTRLGARSQANTTTSPDRTFSLALMGLD